MEECIWKRLPTPQQLEVMEWSLWLKGQDVRSDCMVFLAGTGLRINEARCLDWESKVQPMKI